MTPLRGAIPLRVWGGRVHAPPHWLQAVPPLISKFSFPAQTRRCRVLNLARRVKYIALDRDGSVLIADAENNVIRRFTPKDGKIARVAGTGKRGTSIGDDPLTCELARPHGTTVAPDGALVITDSYNNRILKIVP